MHRFMFFIIMTFNFYLNKRYEIDYFYASTNDDEKYDFVEIDFDETNDDELS